MSKRVYYVSSKHGTRHLVRAHSPAAAIKHAAEGHFTAEVANQDTLIEMLGKGLKVVDAGAEQLDMEDNT